MRLQTLYLLLACVVMLGGCSRCKEECVGDTPLNASISQLYLIQGGRAHLSQKIESRFYQVDTPGSSSSNVYFIVNGNQTSTKIKIGDEQNWTPNDTLLREFRLRPYGQKYGPIKIEAKCFRNITSCERVYNDSISLSKIVYFDGFPVASDSNTVKYRFWSGTYEGENEKGQKTVFINKIYWPDKHPLADSIIGASCWSGLANDLGWPGVYTTLDHRDFPNPIGGSITTSGGFFKSTPWSYNGIMYNLDGWATRDSTHIRLEYVISELLNPSKYWKRSFNGTLRK